MKLKSLLLMILLFSLVSLSYSKGFNIFTDPVLIKQRNTKSGIKTLLSATKSLVDKYPDSYDYNWQYAGALYFYGEFYFTKKKTRKYYFNLSRKYARIATKINPEGVEGHFLLGVASALWADSNGILQSLFIADDVAREMTKVIQIDPAFFQGIPWAIRAQVYGLAPGRPISVGNPQKAYSDFKKAYFYNKGYRVVYQLNVYMLIQHKKWDEAYIIIKKAQALPKDPSRPLEEALAFYKLKGYLKTVNKHRNK